MQFFDGLAGVPEQFGPSAVTIGKFDGVHLGHRRILDTLQAVAAERGLVSTVVTFDRHPLALLDPARCPIPLTSNAQKRELLEATGVDATVMIPFTIELSREEPEEFIQNVLVDALHAKVVFVGSTFRFGHRGRGDVAMLTAAGEAAGFEVRSIDQVLVHDLVPDDGRRRPHQANPQRPGPMTERTALWAGRTMALLGIILVALNLRTAVSGISPIVAQIRVDLPMDNVALGVLGSVPPVIFALSAIFTPMLSRRIGLERLMLIAIIAMVIGHVLRAFSSGFPMLIAGTVAAIAGAGIGNVLLPPLIKRYFPDRVGLLTSIYALLISVSAAVPAVVATPVAAGAGWRFSLGLWSIFAATAAIPWVAVLAERRRARIAVTPGDESPELQEADADFVGRIWHSRVAWSIAIVFATSTLSVYAVFAWLPLLLVQTAGVTPANAGALLALNSIVGAPSAILMPMLALRMRRVGILIQIGVVGFVIAYLGLLFFPSTLPWLWVVFIGIGPLMFPVCLALINLRTRTQRGSVALSGFAQGVGYTLGSLGPLLVGLLHTVTGGWVAPLLFLLAVALVAAVVGTRLSRPTFVEDELAERAARLP